MERCGAGVPALVTLAVPWQVGSGRWQRVPAEAVPPPPGVQSQPGSKNWDFFHVQNKEQKVDVEEISPCSAQGSRLGLSEAEVRVIK